jgi:hypothetical protein
LLTFEKRFQNLKDTFLHNVASTILGQFGEELANCRIIFPNKRPEYYFQKALIDAAGYSIVQPPVSSIEDFIAEHSSLTLAEPLELLFSLYQIHSRYKPDDDFDKFHSWGSMLLRDYDEIDKYLVKQKGFFGNLTAAKELEATDQDEELTLQFWSTLAKQDQGRLKEQFMQHWEIFEKIYYDFNAYLLSKNKAYPGMQYREAAEKIAKGEYNKKIRSYIFVGFNALSKAEESIIKTLLKDNKAAIYFDADKYYLENTSEEAGHFIRKSIKNLNISEPGIISDKLGKEAKNITITGVPLTVAQAKVLGSILYDFIPGAQGTTAIIMPDENMLQPLLFALPENVGEVNFTAGYSLNFTPLYQLFESLSSLQENFDPSIQSFFYKDVLAVLSHPFINCREDVSIKTIIEEIEKYQLIYIPRNKLLKNNPCEIIKLMFHAVSTTSQLLNYMERILSNIEIDLSENEKSIGTFTGAFRTILKKMKELLPEQEFEISMASFWRFFRQFAAQTKIPINEEKPEALQVLGMLESRSLNFDNVFIINVNEGTLPAVSNSHSYIPYDIRKAFGLPVYEEQEALSTYYFYRLLQGAKNIHLLYNSEKGSKGAEPSRYIRQIEYFLKKRNPNIKVERRTFTTPVKSHKITPIEIKKDDLYFAAIEDKSKNGGISPTFISSYYTCALQFMLNYVTKLKPPVEITEELEADRFGTLFHEVMEAVYKEYGGLEITADMIKLQRSRIDHFLNSALTSLHWDAAFYTEKNSLLLETIKVLVNKALDKDQDYAPFYILGMEEKMTFEIELENNKKINLQGTIDRIDEKNGTIRIVDYKTGNVKYFNFNYNDPEEILTKYNKESFQTIFYSYLYYKNTGKENLRPTILPLKKVNEGYQVINSKEQALKKEELDKFEIKLKEILAGIFNKEMPIRQVEDVAICSYCDYKNICLR